MTHLKQDSVEEIGPTYKNTSQYYFINSVFDTFARRSTMVYNTPSCQSTNYNSEQQQREAQNYFTVLERI